MTASNDSHCTEGSTRDYSHDPATVPNPGPGRIWDFASPVSADKTQSLSTPNRFIFGQGKN